MKTNLVQKIGLALGLVGAIACGGSGVPYEFPVKVPSTLPAGKALLTNVVSSSDVRISPASSTQYEMEFTNKQGQLYVFPLVAKDDSPIIGFQKISGHWGTKDNELHFREQASGKFPISLDDYFVLSDGNFSHVLTYVSHDPLASQVTFNYLSSGTVDVTYDSTGCLCFQLVAGGTTYIGNIDVSNSNIEIDLDASGSIVDGDKATIITQAGTEIDFEDLGGYKVVTLTTKAANVLTPASLPCPDEKVYVHIDAESGNLEPIRIADVNVELTETAPGSKVYTGTTAFGLDVTQIGPDPQDLIITEYERQ